jgi:hypothetical protein
MNRIKLTALQLNAPLASPPATSHRDAEQDDRQRIRCLNKHLALQIVLQGTCCLGAICGGYYELAVFSGTLAVICALCVKWL